MLRRTWLTALSALALLGACSRPADRHDTAPQARSDGRSRAAPGSPTLTPADEEAIARDRAPRIVMPLAPPGSGEWSVERVAPARASLDPPLPSAEPADPDSLSRPEPLASEAALKPPIARGLPRIVRAGRGGRVTLDVRVDEQGEVTDAELVASDADSLTVAAAIAAARAMRYHPALLGDQRVAVWCRQVFDVERR